MSDHGKIRVYQCQCGDLVGRHLDPAKNWPEPAVCRGCGASLDGQPFTVEDRQRFMERLLGGEPLSDT